MNINARDLQEQKDVIFTYTNNHLVEECNALREGNEFLTHEICQQLREIGSLQKEIRYTQAYITLLSRKIRNIPCERIKNYTEQTKALLERKTGETTSLANHDSLPQATLIGPMPKQSRGELILERKKLETSYRDRADVYRMLDSRVCFLKRQLKFFEEKEGKLVSVLLKNKNFISPDRPSKEGFDALLDLKKTLFDSLDMDKIDQIRGTQFALITEKEKNELRIRQNEYGTITNPVYWKKMAYLEEIEFLESKPPVDSSELREWGLFKQSMLFFRKIRFSLLLTEPERKRVSPQKAMAKAGWGI